jgi:hypothetical protein
VARFVFISGPIFNFSAELTEKFCQEFATFAEKTGNPEDPTTVLFEGIADKYFVVCIVV